jgi:Ca2+-binding RTX toxin-like protein
VAWDFESFQFSNGTFSVDDILNDAPTDIALSASAVDENAANGTVVAAIAATDADAPLGDTATYTLLDDAGGRFAVSDGNLVVADSGLLDYEAAASHNVTIRVTDAHGAVHDETFTVTLNDLPGVTITGTSGADLVDATHTVAGQPLPTLEADVTNGRAGNDTLYGLGGDDTISGGNGADILSGGDGDDVISGGNNAGILSGGSGNDTLSAGGTSANQTINLETSFVTGGDSTGDVISGFENAIGGLGNDVLTGSSVANILNGGAGADTLAGGGGADQLTGGTGNDIFRFVAASDGGDTIIDFAGGGAAGGDKVDLSAIDATPGGSDDAFTFGGTSATAHGVCYAVSGGNATLYADTDGDTATVEFSIILKGVTSLTQGDDFIL